MKDKEIDAEQILLSNKSLDDLIKVKIEKEFQSAFQKSNVQPRKITITDISKVPRNLIFSKAAVFKLFNRTNGMQTNINGLQAEALLGVQNSLREKMLNGEAGSFAADDCYVKFEQVTVDEQV